MYYDLFILYVRHYFWLGFFRLGLTRARRLWLKTAICLSQVICIYVPVLRARALPFEIKFRPDPQKIVNLFSKKTFPSLICASGSYDLPFGTPFSPVCYFGLQTTTLHLPVLDLPYLTPHSELAGLIGIEHLVMPVLTNWRLGIGLGTSYANPNQSYHPNLMGSVSLSDHKSFVIFCNAGYRFPIFEADATGDNKKWRKTSFCQLILQTEIGIPILKKNLHFILQYNRYFHPVHESDLIIQLCLFSRKRLQIILPLLEIPIRDNIHSNARTCKIKLPIHRAKILWAPFSTTQPSRQSKTWKWQSTNALLFLPDTSKSYHKINCSAALSLQKAHQVFHANPTAVESVQKLRTLLLNTSQMNPASSPVEAVQSKNGWLAQWTEWTVQKCQQGIDYSKIGCYGWNRDIGLIEHYRSKLPIIYEVQTFMTWLLNGTSEYPSDADSTCPILKFFILAGEFGNGTLSQLFEDEKRHRRIIEGFLEAGFSGNAEMQKSFVCGVFASTHREEELHMIFHLLALADQIHFSNKEPEIGDPTLLLYSAELAVLLDALLESEELQTYIKQLPTERFKYTSFVSNFTEFLYHPSFPAVRSAFATLLHEGFFNPKPPNAQSRRASATEVSLSSQKNHVCENPQ